MDAPQRPAAPALAAPALGAAQLEAARTRLSFFALVALLERAAGTPGQLGGAEGPAAEPVRFGHAPELTFSAHDVASVRAVPGAAPRFEVVSTFLGLTGATTPLPHYLAEEVAQEERPHRRQFLDVFHHRLLSLLYRGVSELSLGHAARADATDAWARRVLALAGVDAAAGPAPLLGPGELLRLAPLLAGRARPAHALEQALEDVLGAQLGGARARVRPFVLAHVAIPQRQRAALGRANVTLGRDLVLGARVRDRGGQFDVELGPVTEATYRRFLPGGDLAARVDAVVRTCVREPLAYGVVLVLPREETPRLQLAAAGTSRLGRDSWLGRPPAPHVTVRVRAPA